MHFLSMEELLSRRGRNRGPLTEQRIRSVLPTESRRRARSLLDGEDAEEESEDDEWEDEDPVDIHVDEVDGGEPEAPSRRPAPRW